GNDLIHNYGRTPPRDEAMYGATEEEAAQWIKNFEARLNGAVEEIRGHFPAGCHIFIATILDPTDERGDIQNAGLPRWKDGLKLLDAYNKIILQCADRYSFVHIVHVHASFLGHGIHCRDFLSKRYHRSDPHYWYYTNLEDPNERGYDAMRRLFLIEMA